MSYTLKGRLESRLAALFPVLAAACLLAVVLLFFANCFGVWDTPVLGV